MSARVFIFLCLAMLASSALGDARTTKHHSFLRVTVAAPSPAPAKKKPSIKAEMDAGKLAKQERAYARAAIKSEASVRDTSRKNNTEEELSVHHTAGLFLETHEQPPRFAESKAFAAATIAAKDGGGSHKITIATDGKTAMSELKTREGLGENMPFPGVGYLGAGYDLLKGNPEGAPDTYVDPGFRQSVIELKWDQSDPNLTRDFQSTQPIGGWADVETACNQVTSCVEQNTMSDYTASLETATSVSAGYDGVVGSASFQASVGTQSFQNEVINKKSKRFQLKAFCLKYKAGFNKENNTLILPTPEFERRAKMLPVVGEISCTGATSCVDLYNEGVQKYLTVIGGDLKFVDQFGASTKWAFDKSSGSASKLTHLASQRSLKVTVKKDKSLHLGLTTAAQGSSFKYDKIKGALDGQAKPKNTRRRLLSRLSRSFESFLERASDDAPAKKANVVFHLAAPASPAAKSAEAGVNDGNHAGLVKASKGKGSGGAKKHSIWRFQATSAQDEEPWSNFFEDFGTHFIDELHLGGRMSHEIIMISSQVDSLTDNGVDIGAEFEGEFGSFSGGAKTQVTMSKSQKSAFGKMSKKTKTVVLGGNPPSDLKKGFGEWAETVSEAPMPVKYTVRPLTEANSKYLDPHSYRTMVVRYMSNQLKKAKARQKKALAKLAKNPWVLKPGESWTSDVREGYSHKGTTLKINGDGRISITDKFNRGLWDSIYHDWSGSGGTYTLTYQTDGDLVLKNDKGTTIWHSATTQTQCGGSTSKEVRFEAGYLTITNAGGQVWSSETRKGSGDDTQMAAKEYFGTGLNKCIKKSKCVVLFGKENFGGKKCEMGLKGPVASKVGYYDRKALKQCSGIDDENYSAKVEKGVCWAELWEDDEFNAGGWGSGDYDVYMQDEKDTDKITLKSGGIKDSFQGSDDANTILIHSTADYQNYYYHSQIVAKGSKYKLSGLGMPRGKTLALVYSQYTSKLQEYYSACSMPLGNVFCK